MAVMCENGKFFNKRLMQQIKQKNNSEVLSILQNVDPCQLNDNFGNTLLHYAAEFGNNEFAQHLIDMGAAVDARNRRRQTPLFFAVDGDQEDTVLLLVKANADLFSRDISDCPLARAFQLRPNIAMTLLRTITVDYLKKNVEHVKSEKFRPYFGLRQFVLLKNVEITRFLLENGSPVNTDSRETGNTALHLAVEQLDLEMVKLLLEFNANVNARDLYRQTPVGRILITRDAEHDKALAILKVLVAAGAMLIDRETGEPMVRHLLSSGNREIIRFLLRGHIDLQYMEVFQWLYLHELAGNKQPDVLAEVPNLESFVKIRDFQGATMLHTAASYRNVNAVKYLLDNGADVDAENSLGETPLDWVIGAHEDFEKYDDTFYELLNLAEVLLERGARPRLILRMEMTHFFTPVIKDKYLSLLEPVLAYLALREASGEAIDGSSHNIIKIFPQCKSILDSMRQQVGELKRTDFGKTVTLIDFFHASDRQLLLYARIQNVILRLTDAMKGCNSDSYLHRKLRQRFVKFTQLIRARTKLITIINDCFMEFHNISVNTIAEKIVSFLKCQELYKMSSIFE